MSPSRDMRALAAQAGAFALALAVPVCAGLGRIGLAELFAVLAIAIVSCLAGRTLALLLRLPHLPGFIPAFEVVAGFAAVSLLQLVAVMGLTLAAVPAFALVTALVSGMLWVSLRRIPSDAMLAAPTNRRGFAIDAAVMLAIAIVVTLWTREVLGALHGAQATGVFYGWTDFFLHASEITYLTHYPAFAGYALYLADTPRPLYHIGSYAMSAVYSAVTGETSLAVATGFWLPAGLVLMGIGLYGFGSALGGRLAGGAAAASVLLLPDASMYGLRNGFFGFHWLMQTSPSAGYAVAIVLVALGVYAIGVRTARMDLVLASAVLAATSTVFRIHIAIPAALLFFVLGVLRWKPQHGWHRWVVLVALAVGGFLGLELLEQIALAPHFLSGKFTAISFFRIVHGMKPSAYHGIYKIVLLVTGTMFDAPVATLINGSIGLLLLMLAAFGMLLPLVVWYLVRRQIAKEWAIDAIPLVLLAVYVAVIIGMPGPAYGDITEYGHRSFVLVYAVMLAMLAVWAVVLIRQRPHWHKPARMVAAFLLVSGLGVPLIAGRSIQQSRLSWGPSVAYTPMSAELGAAAEFIRTHAAPTDRVLSSDLDPKARVVALTEHTAFLSRADVYRGIGGDAAVLAAARGEAAAALTTVKTYPQLIAFGQEHHLRWYLLLPDTMPWPPMLLQCAQFTSGGVRVFDLSINTCPNGHEVKQ